MSARALRRHHIGRLKNNRRCDWHAGFCLNAHVTTPKRCSCWMCGNPRRFNGNGKEAKTMQERRKTQEQAERF